MRIGCLQFASQVGDLENNLNRADAVLNRVDPDSLDLLVLPELAFSGYNFKSLRDISPFLEHKGSGITSLWARTVALKYDCTVVVGYPEKVDPALKWPADPEYYNSAIVVNGDGETVGNYRKNHLYHVDETWALENPKGFYSGFLPGLGYTAMGICMDLNPYKFKAPWDAFEFAFHVKEVQANLVIVSMAWMTAQDSRQFTRMPQEPDMDTLHYWITRLEPLIRSEDGDEVIVVFANRCGTEDDALYAGTSAVVGIQDGEVRVYGILGRGVKDLLVVDTNVAASARLVYRPDGAFVAPVRPGNSSKAINDKQQRSPIQNRSLPDATQGRTQAVGADPISSIRGSESNSVKSPAKSNATAQSTPTLSSRILSQNPYSTSSHRLERPELSLRIDSSSASQEADAPTIQTPTCPSPTPMSLRPRLVIPPTDSITMKYLNEHSAIRPTTAINEAYPVHKLTPHPNALSPIEQIRILGGEVMITREGTTPGTSPSQVSMSHFSDASPASPKLYWVPATRMLETPLEKRGWTPGGASDRTDISDTSWAESRSEVAPAMSRHNYLPWSAQVSNAQQILTGETSRPSLTSKFHLKDNFRNGVDSHRENSTEVERPSSPKSRNASRSRGPERLGSASEPDAKLEQLALKLDEIAQRVDSAQGVHNPQRRRHSSARGSNDGMSVSGNSIPIAACASIWRSSSRVGNQPPMESKSSSHTSQILSQGDNSVSSARGREKNLPASRSSARQYHQSSDHVTRQVSRGRQPDAHTPSRQSSRASPHPANRSKTAIETETENEPSNLRHVEETTSLSCPIHGGQTHSKIHPNGPQSLSDELHSHHDRSSASLHSRPGHLTKLEQPGGEQASQERPKSSGSRVVHSRKNNIGARASPRTTDAGTPSSFEPKTPKAMTLSFEVNSPQLSDSGLKCVEPKHLPSISRPKSAVW